MGDFESVFRSTDYDPSYYFRAKGKLERYSGLTNRMISPVPEVDREHIIEKGPNIIVMNHPGLGRDIAALARVYDKQLYFVAAEYLFSKEATIKKAEPFIDELGRNYAFVRFVANIVDLLPIINYVADYVSEKIKTLEMIPMNMDYNGDVARKEASQRAILDTIQGYMEQEKTVVMFQFHKNFWKIKNARIKEKSGHHNYLPKFNDNISEVIYGLCQRQLDVPITPVAFYSGSNWNPFSKTVLRIGPHTYFRQFMEYDMPVQKFTEHLEGVIADMLEESGIPRNWTSKTHKIYKRIFVPKLINGLQTVMMH